MTKQRKPRRVSKRERELLARIDALEARIGMLEMQPPRAVAPRALLSPAVNPRPPVPPSNPRAPVKAAFPRYPIMKLPLPSGMGS